MFGGKSELLAKGLFWTGAPFVFGQLPTRDVLLVLNYHRIGNPDDDLLHPELFSATADQLSEQISYLSEMFAGYSRRGTGFCGRYDKGEAPSLQGADHFRRRIP